MTHASIVQVTVWKTTDGQVFDTPEEANAHQEQLEATQLHKELVDLIDQAAADGDFDWRDPSANDLANGMLENSRDFLAFFQRLHQPQT